jgi:opacity protein-like surface antigen
MNITIRPLLLSLASALMLLPVAAQAQSGSAERRAGNWYIGGGLGGFAEEDNARLSGQDGKFATFFGGGYRASPYVAIEADIAYWRQDFATPGSITLPNAEPRTDLNTVGAGGLVKLYLPIDSVDLYVGGGLGLYTSQLYVEGSSGGATTKIDEDDTNVGYQLTLGADVYVSNRISVGVEYRWLKLEANFEPLVAGKIDVGGQFLFATVRGHF